MAKQRMATNIMSRTEKGILEPIADAKTPASRWGGYLGIGNDRSTTHSGEKLDINVFLGWTLEGGLISLAAAGAHD